MITQDYDKSVSKKQESGLKWLIIFLGKVCSVRVSHLKIFACGAFSYGENYQW